MNTVYYPDKTYTSNEILANKKQYKTVYFVTKSLYDEVINRDFSNQDFLYVLNTFSANKLQDKLSDLTYKFIKFSNDYIHCKVFETNKLVTKDEFGMSQKESLSIISELEMYLNNSDYTEGQKYYELKVLDEHSLLAVVNQGFFEFITKSKMNLREFYLELLRVSYDSNSELDQLLFNYIKLGVYDSHYELLKSKILF